LDELLVEKRAEQFAEIIFGQLPEFVPILQLEVDLRLAGLTVAACAPLSKLPGYTTGPESLYAPFGSSAYFLSEFARALTFAERS